MTNYFSAKPKLLAVLQSGGAREQIFTSKQVFALLRNYIGKNKLYDPQNMRIIRCKNDLLGEVLRCDEFIIGENHGKKNGEDQHGKSCNENAAKLWKLLSPHLTLVSKKETVKEPSQEDKEGECSTSTEHSQLPWWYFVEEKGRKDANPSQSTGTRSYDRGETIYVQDTDYEESEDDVNVELDSEGHNYYADEMEPVDIDDSDATEPVSSDDDEYPSSEIESLQKFQSDCGSSTDDETGTSEFSLDSEIGFEEYWSCHECKSKNSPTVSYCQRCWKLRKGWITQTDSLTRSATDPLAAATSVDVPDTVGRSMSTGSPSTIVPVIPSFSEPSSSLQQDSTTSSPERLGFPGICTLCRSNPNNATLIHGRTGHQLCCYRCAKRLKKNGKRCPLCRQRIMLVVKNFICNNL